MIARGHPQTRLGRRITAASRTRRARAASNLLRGAGDRPFESALDGYLAYPASSARPRDRPAVANLTSMYDLPELMSNRYGPLQIDRPHSFKLDLYHRWPIGRADAIILGGRGRLQSGRPHSVLAGNPYGIGESYLLPRGTGERAPFESALDGLLAYRRELGKGISLEGYIDIFNLFDQQPATKLDEIWTYANINPIVGGDAFDLEHAKVLDANGQPTDREAHGRGT